MPAGNGTGPTGMGPMTGRGMGFCTSVSVPGSMNTVPDRGFRGRGVGGGGRGWRNMFYATGLTGWQRTACGMSSYMGSTKEQELETLKGQAKHLEDALGNIRKRLQKLEVEKTAKK